MTIESKMPDNNSTLGNYIIAIITAVIYVLVIYSDALADMLFFCSTTLGILVLPAIFSGIYYLFKRKGFSKVFAWSTVILCIVSYFGHSLE